MNIKKFIILFSLIPTFSYSQIINLSCERFKSVKFDPPFNIDEKIEDGSVTWFIKIDIKNQILDINDGLQRHNIVITDDYYKTPNFKGSALPYDYPIGTTAMQINRKTGIYKLVYYYLDFEDNPQGWEMEFNCSKAENKF